jgi:hypothetical protein
MSGESFLTVAQSSNGSTWNTLGTYGTCSGCTAITDCADITHTLSPTSRYIRWLYTKATGNVGLDDVSITSCGTAPSNQVTAINITNASPTSQNLVLTRGNGARVIVLARAGGAVNSDPVDGTSYTANSVFGSGSQIGQAIMLFMTVQELHSQLPAKPTVRITTMRLMNLVQQHVQYIKYLLLPQINSPLS